jgi:hypothetical protein
VVDLREGVLLEQLSQPGDISDVGLLDYSTEVLRDAVVSQCDHVVDAVHALQFGDEFCPHLSEGASHEYLLVSHEMRYYKTGLINLNYF